jgi:predicted phosphodiesterase
VDPGSEQGARLPAVGGGAAGPRASRRARLAAGLACAAVVAVALVAWRVVWPFMTVREDFLPGRAPTIELEPHAWDQSGEMLRFAVVGDNGTGGRNQMRVARQMALTYRDRPYGLVVHTGDLVYYGNLVDRWDQVMARPMGPLLDAGVQLFPVLGNHEFDYVATLRVLERFGLPGRYYSFVAGPVEFFMLDSTPPEFAGEGGSEQLAWLERRLRASTAEWQVAVLHHPLYSSGRHGSDLRVREALEPLFVEHGVDLVLAGHDHSYERTTPQSGIVHVVTGGGAKRSPVGTSEFTAVSGSVLHFVVIDVLADRMVADVVTASGDVFDHFEVRPR